MPNPTPKKKASASSKPKPSKTQTQKPQPNEAAGITPVEEVTTGSLEADVIASLVKSGVPYADAVAQVQGGSQAAPVAPVEEPDIPPPVVKPKKQETSDEQYALYQQLDEIEDQEEYEITFSLKGFLYAWLIRVALSEASYRGQGDFLIADMMRLMIKEQRASDPTKGGTRTHGGSGPKDMYNPVSGDWGG